MRFISVKRVILIALIFILPACVTTTSPPESDKKTRAPINGKQSASAFQRFCFNPGVSTTGVRKAIQKNGNFNQTSKPDDNLYSASHKTVAVDVIVANNRGCLVNFIAPKSAADSAAEAALALIKPVGAKSIGGKQGSGQIALKTAKGTVLVSNIHKTVRNGVQILLLRK